MSESTDRTPPNDVGAERVTLGSMMLSRDAVGDIIEILDSEDYYRPAHGAIHRAIHSLYSRGEPTDPVAVTGHLLESGDLGAVKGASYLHECVEAVPAAANGAYYARRVHDAAGRRRLIEAGALAVRTGYNPEIGLPEAIDQAGAALLEATGKHTGGDIYDAFADLDQVIAEIHESGNRPEGLNGVPTGFSDLDRLLNGLKPGQFVVVAGRPGMGKSTVAVDFVRHAVVRGGFTAMMFSLEMERGEIMRRILSAESRVPLHTLNSGHLNVADTESLNRRKKTLGEAARRFLIDDSPGVTVTDIRARARRVAQRGPLDLILVDYLQLMTPSGRKSDNRQQEVADISRGLKLLAKELGVPVIAVAQLNRGVEQRTDKRPMLSDLRESGALEQDADIVLMVHREQYYDPDTVRKNEADLIVAKHRGGATDTITVAAQLHLARFVDMARV